MIRLAVVGHVEWVDFVLADRLPAPGEIADARASWEAAAGGGAMAAYALKSLTGAAAFFCALGDDARADATLAGLRDAGIDVRAARHARPQRRTLTWLTADHERTITTLAAPLEPSGADSLDWSALEGCDGAVLFGGDAAAARAARAAKVLVATARTRAALLEAGVEVDALVGSANDATEPLDDALLAAARPRWVVETEGERGGRWRAARTAGTEAGAGAPGAASPVCELPALDASGRWDAAPPPGPAVDAFGCGDAFAAALMAALAAGRPIADACALGARVGAAVLGQRAPAVGDLAPLWAP
ncbi:MAG TPA: PfkB family carbohydrate kinase [Baekduia sp.]|uniref:PfkB family carbohydrate kinase n=1 Tax=Baekduia sp. TaxID=2600305 RepID=UPI002D7A2985|nr:PfkB family carbohydrate kinase [Baekduia sp.]HET6510445.1 PfkB family carbohydrate kinase [Baekduia sp.]